MLYIYIYIYIYIERERETERGRERKREIDIEIIGRTPSPGGCRGARGPLEHQLDRERWREGWDRFMLGLDYNFIDYTFNNTLNVKQDLWPEGCSFEKFKFVFWLKQIYD